MDKDNTNSTFDFDMDPEFHANFYKNIEKVLGDTNVEELEEIVIDENEDENIQVKDVENEDTEEDNNDKDTPIKLSWTERASEIEAAENELTCKKISEDEIDDELTDIKASLAKQICDELELNVTSVDKKKKHSRWMKIQSGVLIALLVIVGIGAFLGFTKPGNKLLMSMGVDLSGKIWAVWTGNFDDSSDLVEDTDYLDEDDLNSDAEEVDPNTIVWPEHPGEGKKVAGVYNILLIGEEAIGAGSGRGRTDVIIIATMNTNTKSLKVTSLMRDMLVQIPGYKDNKLNSAYEKGGVDLLYETIAKNFDIRLDGCVMVNFENFEKIIDELGGLELTLTAGEAKYLNTTNYISNPIYRRVKEGKQLLNGNQVLGYSRVRKRSTITGKNNDYGRTDRHRIILNAIFDKYKSKSKVELASMMIKILPMITSDIDEKTFQSLLNTFIEMGTMEIEQLRIPADGKFADNVKVRGMDVLIPDLSANIELLHEFIFGKEVTQ